MAQAITFHGAAQTVTGSKHLLEVDGKQILVDCGLFQGGRELRERNWLPFGFDPLSLDAVIVTHAHIDHIGLLPKLIKEGYRGPLYATPGTIGLARISLPDSGRLQEEEAKYHNKHRSSRHDPALPLYTEADAFEALKLFKPIRYNQLQSLPGGASFRFLPAGHILGSGYAEVFFENGDRILMGGDLGRFNTPIINDPTMVEYAEYLVVESTYGDRLHSTENAKDRLREVIQAAIQDHLTIIVPSFSIGRTQELLYYINELQRERAIGFIPIYVDSPMGVSATALYDKTLDDHDLDMRLRLDEGDDPLDPDGLTLVRDVNQSKAINSMTGPMMIIAGSGMANGGRVIHHLKHRLRRRDTLVLFTGYQAEGTMGRDLLEGASEVTIHGQPVEVNAQVDKLNSLSAHADQGEIMHWLRGFKEPPRKTFIVHGEPKAQETLAEKIRAELGWNVIIPRQGERVEL
ncbi:MAG: MBL fold metallo-hydrolase [Chthonomonas sp.]|nr:MBL fold metallo-hydrolase [Chthonomonas sp.]